MFAPVATEAGTGRTVLTREKVRERFARFVDLYGEPPRAADLNPSAAKWAGQLWRAARYRAGDPETGEPWPSLNSVKKLYDGKLNAAIRDAGFEPHRPGPPRRRDVDPGLAREHMTPDARVAFDGATARVRELEDLVAVRDRQLKRAREARVPTARTETRVVERTRTVVDDVGLREARRDAKLLRGEVARLRRDVDAGALALRTALSARDEARTSAKRAASSLERREAALRDVRDQKREALARARALERRLEGAVEAAAAARREAEAAEPRTITRTETVFRDAPERVEMDAALRAARDADARAAAAESGRARADAAYLELAAAVSGEPRRLSAAEVAELRTKGPAGPALVAAAIRKLALARRAGGSGLDAALRELAAAAISWRERL